MHRARLGASLALAALAATAVTAGPARAQHPAIDSAVVHQLRGPQTREAEILGASRLAEGSRFFAVAVRAARLSGAPVGVMACAADSAATITVRCVPLPTPGIDRSLYAADSPRVVVRDLDGDGHADAVLSLSYGGPTEPAVGPPTYGRAYVVQLEPAPAVRASFEMANEPGASGLPHRTGTLGVEDVNGDGKPELVVRGQRCNQRPETPDAACRDYTQTWVYRPAARRWERAAAAPRR